MGHLRQMRLYIGEIRKHLETNENQHNIPKLKDAAKAVLRENFMTVNTYIKKIRKI